MDATRSRPEYVNDVFEVLEWLGVEWHSGPRSTDEFERDFTLARRRDLYRDELEAARGQGLMVYACRCTRRELAGGRACECRAAALPYRSGETSLRVHVPEGTTVTVDSEPIDLASRMGDFVVWRRDDLPAYHLASVIEDRDHGVTDIVRGRDLLESSAAQLFLADALGAAGFGRARLIHHDLLADQEGAKLSKSQVTRGQPLPRTREQYADIVQVATRYGARWGITPPP